MFLAYLDPEDERLLEEDLNTPTDSKRWDFEKHLWYIFCIHFSLFKALFRWCFLSMKDEQIWNFFADLDSTILRYHGCGRQNTFLQSTTDSHRNQITPRESKCCKTFTGNLLQVEACVGRLFLYQCKGDSYCCFWMMHTFNMCMYSQRIDHIINILKNMKYFCDNVEQLL